MHGDSRHIRIVTKEDKPGIDIHISGEAKDEQVHIPVVMSQEGVDVVYNDFYIEDGADVTIIAGCGIHGEGCSETRHDGIHTFHVEKDAMSNMWKTITQRVMGPDRKCSIR